MVASVQSRRSHYALRSSCAALLHFPFLGDRPVFLKRLELHGFKSFAHKTGIDFLPGVTIVVGPNGCGKSNVLDSIRWVLGETSAKSLRGSKMGDVVFRGSASLKPSHFAQVSLLVNNEASHLKIDQSEVLVSRRLFSDGDADYMINKQKARMRDVHELFLDTGLGADNYAIIEQGQISNMVQAKPAQRREIFEEAAGISRYKARREETMRKLIRTEEDLLRLFDIVSEVQRACNSLYRQARKAVRHRKLTRRLARLQKRLLVVRQRLLADKLTGVEGKLAQNRTLFEEASARLASAEARHAEASRLVEDFQRQNQELQQQRYDLQQAINREQRRIESARQAIEAIGERVALLDREMSASENRQQVLSTTISALETDLARERGTLETESATLETRTRRLESLRREHDESTGILARLRHEIASERAKENKVLQDMRLSESLVERLTAELASHDETTATLRAEAEAAARDAETARGETERRRTRLAELRDEAKRLEDSVRSQSQEKNDLARSLDAASRTFNQAQSRLEALEELEASYEGFYRGVQVVMKAAQGNRLAGVVGVLTNLLAAKKEYEVAMEVALGGALQDIVVRSERDAQAAIAYLKEQKAGRATFLPLDLLQTQVRYDHLMQIIKRPGVVGFAKDLVEYDKVIEKAVERRLGNTIIVEALPVAVDLARQGHRNRYVSLDGELVDPSGVLTGGSHQARGFLSRSREIRILRDDVARLGAERQRIHDDLARASDALSQSHARRAELQDAVHQEQMAEARAEKDLQAAEARLRDRRNALASAEARQLQQRHDLGQHRERIDTCRAGVEELAALIAGKEARLAEIETGGATRSKDLEQVTEEVGASRALVSGLRERVNGLSSKLADVRNQISGTGAEQENREREKRQLLHQRESSAQEATEAEKLLADLVHQRETLEARISQLTQENEVSLRDARAAMAEIQGLQRDRNVRENELREVELAATELRAQIKVLEQEAQDTFQLSIRELATELEQKMVVENELLENPEGQQDEADKDEDDDLFEEDDQVTDPSELRRLVNEMRDKITRMGAVNETAIDEFKQQKERLDFLTAQRDDLIKAKESLTETIANLDATTKKLFDDAYTAIRQNFQEMFRRLFNGGKGDLVLVEEEGEPEPGIDIYAQPPGKNIGGSIALMSGGEKAMTAIALMLSLFRYKPSPVCILDEIDAPLDDVNCMRLCDAIKDFARTTQFLVITHNKITMGLADTIYGVTMQEPGISKIVSVRFDKLDESGLLEGVG